ncbi:MAG: S16 family serine protease [Candidatus Micrarchaeaceae archaeon]
MSEMRILNRLLLYAAIIFGLAFLVLGIANGLHTYKHPQIQFSGNIVGRSTIYAPAVILSNNSGIITEINLTITSGTGSVQIVGPRSVGLSTLDAAKSAALFASNYLGLNESNYNFTYQIDDYNASVSGPSAGGAMTLLALSAFTGKPLLNNFTMTGTINPNGSIGPIGGVYDKMSAASAMGLKFGLVPYTLPGSFENELYVLIRYNFRIPIIEISNVSQAFGYATGTIPIAGHNVTYDFYTKYDVPGLQSAPLQCSNSCNVSRFASLANFTFNMTEQMINSLPPRFGGIVSNLSSALLQAEQVSSKGYYYAGADLAFLDYINAYLMHSSSDSKSVGLEKLQNISLLCNSLSAPQLTKQNFEYVLGGELRQAWGNFTVESLIANYNSTTTDSDGVMENMYEGGLSKAWCSSAAYMYGVASSIGGNASYISPALNQLAASRLSSAAKYGDSYYYSTAREAYLHGNYPLAILDADFAMSEPIASSSFSLNSSSLDAMASKLANSSTYGIWATQYANEAMFYVYESHMAQNSSEAHTYATSAYSSAVLASLISNDTRNISNSIISAEPLQQGLPSTYTYLLTGIYGVLETIIILMLVILIIVAITLGFILMLVHRVSKMGSAWVQSQNVRINRKGQRTSQKTKR